MPELPEVETVKNVLNQIVKDRTIIGIDVFNARQIEGDKDVFISSLKNQTILEVTRIGKYLIFHLTNDLVMISHLRMEGKYFEYEENEPNSKYARVVFHFDNLHKLCYDDSRTFGILKLSNEKDYLNEEMIKKLGPEPFKADAKIIYDKTRKIKTPIKTALLDQTLMTGLGNIYVDETLYLSKIHPHTPSNIITLEEYQIIIDNACKVLSRAIELGGSTIKSYHPGKNIDGAFQNEIRIYGKKGETCPICGHTFLFTKTNGRGTTFCPMCQHKKGKPLNIGLTGKIASGKSTALKIFKDLGVDVISSDEIVRDLYQKEEIVNTINKMFKLSFLDKVDHKILRDYLLIHPKDKKKLERYIHPLVKKEIEQFFLHSPSPIRLAEVPLLFKAHYEDIFDTIIIVDVSEEIQLERLNKRNKDIAPLLLEINKDNMIEENKNKAEFLVFNDNSEEKLIEEIKAIVSILKYRLN